MIKKIQSDSGARLQFKQGALTLTCLKSFLYFVLVHFPKVAGLKIRVLPKNNKVLVNTQMFFSVV